MSLAEIKSQAIHWVVELDTAEQVEELWPALEAWLQQGVEHRRAYTRAERTWRMLDELGRLHRRRDSRSTRWLKRLSSFTSALRRMAISPAIAITAIALAAASLSPY